MGEPVRVPMGRSKRARNVRVRRKTAIKKQMNRRKKALGRRRLGVFIRPLLKSHPAKAIVPMETI